MADSATTSELAGAYYACPLDAYAARGGGASGDVAQALAAVSPQCEREKYAYAEGVMIGVGVKFEGINESYQVYAKKDIDDASMKFLVDYISRHQSK